MRKPRPTHAYDDNIKQIKIGTCEENISNLERKTKKDKSWPQGEIKRAQVNIQGSVDYSNEKWKPWN